MGTPSNAENTSAVCSYVIPVGGSKSANYGGNASNIIGHVDATLKSAAGNIFKKFIEFVTFTLPTTAMLTAVKIGDKVRTYFVDSTKTNPYDADEFIYTRNGFVNLCGAAHEIDDAGNAGAIPVTSSGHVKLVTAGAETRTLAAPSFAGQILSLSMKTDGGDCVLTCATTINQAGNNTITFNDAGDCVTLIAKSNGANLRWSVLANDGATLATV